MKTLNSSQNSIWIEAPAEEIWPYFSTAVGWNSYLSDIAKATHSKNQFSPGDSIEIVIGELTNYSYCLESCKPSNIVFQDHYSVILPDGNSCDYNLVTSFTLKEKNLMTYVTVTVTGYRDDEWMQWVRECGEMGWRQSLFNLKSVIELGLDLRNEIFNYPRLGVLNFTATSEHINQLGITDQGIRGNWIGQVYPGGPADKAGLKSNILVTEINHREVPDYTAFTKELGRQYKKNNPVCIKYYDGIQFTETEIKLTYDDQFTGMVDPTTTPLEEIAKERKKKSRSK